MCTKNGAELSGREELLLRQVSPRWFEEDGEPSSQAFCPRSNVDDGCLSVDRGSITTPEAAFQLFTTLRPEGFSGNSAGVWAIDVSEVIGVGLSTWADPVLATETLPPNMAHAVVEYSALERSKWKKVARQLKMKARDRQRLFPLPEK